jgi:mono/diheme cytochrome c family protein
VLVFKLGGTAQLPVLKAAPAPVLSPPPDAAPAPIVEKGKALYQTYCSTCHGDAAAGSGILPDLRYSAALQSAEALDAIARQGALMSRGMIAF